MQRLFGFYATAGRNVVKKILLGLVLLAVLAAAGAAIYAASIDWNQHKDQIAARFAEVTGKNIVFAGPVSFEFLPQPKLTAESVRIFNPGNRSQPLVEVKSLKADLALKPLLKGIIDVDRMVLVDPQINVEVEEDGSLNWQHPLTPEQRDRLENAEVALNSVSLQNATVNFEMPSQNISLKLDDLNGEIIAQSIMGPYRIEGNYIKDKNPEGFAISVGKLSDAFATTLNLVFTHPVSKSYVRFDGSFLLSNKVLNGNVIVESEKLKDFINATLKSIDFKPAYDYPLALTFDLNANEQQVNLTNMVIKYGDTQGAGTIQIPLNDGLIDDDSAVKPRVDMAFNFTDFDLDPVVYTVRDFINKYKGGKGGYEPEFPFDMLVDVKSLKTQYNDQPVKNFEISFDAINNIITVNNLTATLPGETDIKIKGDLSSYEGEPFYNLETSFNASNFLKTLNWMHLEPTVSAAATYRRATGNAKLSGTLNRIQISPFALTIDKSSLSGEAGVKLGQRPDILLVLKADSVNFDNYIAALPVEEQEKSWAQRMQYRFGKLGIVNDFDMQLKASFDLAIYENMPFEKVDVAANLLDGKLEVKQLHINSVANSQMEFAGIVKGFGAVPAYENLKYAVKTKDVASLINKLEFKVPDLNFKQLKNFESKGIATGTLDKFAVKAISRLEEFDFAFAGQITRGTGGFSYNGQLEAKHPDFVKMLNDFNIAYDPQVYSLGLFNLKTKFAGTPEQFRANPLEFNIGFNSFSGELNYDNSGERPNILTSLKINKLEAERFLNKPPAAEAARPAAAVEENAEFLAKPLWSRSRINYAPLQKFDLSGIFEVKELSYKDYGLKNARADLSVADGVFNLNTLSGEYRGVPVTARLTVNSKDKTSASGNLKLTGIDVSFLPLAGTKYGITAGKADMEVTANSLAGSPEEIVSTLNGNMDITINSPTVKGLNLTPIYNDIIKREVPDGLQAFVTENLSSGSTQMNLLTAKLSFTDGNFALHDTVLTGSGVTASLFGDGSLPNWDMNVNFNVKYDEPQWLPGYAFALKGPMNAPLLDVNVSALFNLYKSRQDKIAAEARAREDAEKNRLQGLADEQKKAANVLLAEVKNRLLPLAESRLKEVQSEQAAEQLQQARDTLEQIGAEIAANVNRGLSPEITDKLIEEMAKANREVSAKVETVQKAIEAADISNLKFVMKADYERLVESLNQGKLLAFNFTSEYNAYKSRLAQIETSFKMEDDANIIGWEQFISDKAKLINEESSGLMGRYIDMQKSADAAALRDYNAGLQKMSEDVNADVSSMAESLDKFKEYAEQKVEQAEEDYKNKLREEEVQRKLEENTGVINIKKTGKSVTVQRDIEEIEKSEELTSQEKVKVLDFTAPREEKAASRPVKKTPVKKGRVIRN